MVMAVFLPSSRTRLKSRNYDAYYYCTVPVPPLHCTVLYSQIEVPYYQQYNSTVGVVQQQYSCSWSCCQCSNVIQYLTIHNSMNTVVLLLLLHCCTVETLQSRTMNATCVHHYGHRDKVGGYLDTSMGGPTTVVTTTRYRHGIADVHAENILGL